MDYKKATRFVTIILIPVLITLILAYDFVAVVKGGSEASISSLIIRYSYKMPFFVYMVGLFNGILVGHLFWRMRSNEDTKEIDGQGK